MALKLYHGACKKKMKKEVKKVSLKSLHELVDYKKKGS